MSAELMVSHPNEVSDDLERRVLSGQFPPGTRLPSEQRLASDYGTTRSRIRSALAVLAQRGVVVSHANAGWFVQTGRQSWGVESMRTFSEWCTSHGRKHGGQIVHREHAGAAAHEAAVLGIKPGDDVLKYVRVRTIDGLSVMVEHTAWAPWVTQIVEKLPNDVPSVYQAMRAAGVRIELGDHRIEVTAATGEDATLLGVRRSSPLLLVTRSGMVPEGLAVEVSTDRYIPGLVAFDIRQSTISKEFLLAQRVTAQRLLRARLLLETTDAPVEEIAGICGFSSAALFRRQFARETGVTPAVYRRSYGTRNTP